MRGLFTTSLLAASLAGVVLAHPTENGGKRRKTLGFGPDRPHAVFKSSPYDITTSGFIPQSALTSPMDVARIFVDDLLRDQEARSYRVRKDSYTDETTGITHVYFRQLVDGVEVADADINVNVQDGMVLSYGDSFYKGPLLRLHDRSLVEGARWPHTEHCNSLTDELVTRYEELRRSRMANLQTPMGNTVEEMEEALSPIVDAHHSNCLYHDVPHTLAHKSKGDIEGALLQFMIAATPNDDLVNDMLARYDDYVSEMSAHPVNSFAPGESPYFMVNNVPDTVNPVKAKMAFVQIPTAEGDSTVLHPVYKFEVEMQDNWYEAAVSAEVPHRIISVVDWASDSPIPKPDEGRQTGTYNVFAWGVNDPSEGERSIQKEYFDALASPVGWHTIPYANDPTFDMTRAKPKGFYKNTTTTYGNNVFAQENWEGRNAYLDNYRPDAGSSLAFDYKYDPKETDRTDALEEAKGYINNTVTQLFYTCNLIHDFYYRYGFTEAAGNFQQYNFGRGGAENDGVIANAQDGSGYNNANFMTPPDGQNGRMRMYLWNTIIPYRDGDLEAGIVVHEFAHGLSTRLTGGPANSGCLGWGESGGMGEGWGDFIATSIRATANYSDYTMGAWAANREGGIRNYPYSTNETVNPSTYKTLDKPGYWGVHAIGEVWAEILFVVQQRLIAVHGFSDTLFPPLPDAEGNVPEGDFYRARSGKKPLVPKHGNTLSVQLVISAMKLQPCRPSFFDARDAIIAADEALTGGENFCTLWKGFSERGLGPDAKLEGSTPWGGGIRTNDHSLPTACAADKL
ncbi:Fungalysin metallopeptidase-domain-containing protein [Schizophyllum amplum]|uniref:Extracellular metalloproteinase n=1 Tax=Schizophyllum amplum TaxID=97359 RepID=A0A550CPJ8_9AGAR|nr:Fungalysin metallopeptidase-domain-containing protein [Auriculariopsis ampla]